MENLTELQKEKKLQDFTDISIEILDMLVAYGYVPTNEIDNETEIFVQDKINTILIRNLIK
jgi:uncharacterized protein (DUF342 family)